jgi:transposase
MSARISIRLRRHVRRRLERTRRKTKEAHYRSRLQIVLLYDKGWGCGRVAEAVGCAPSTAVRVARRFAELGEDGLLDGRRENGEPKVDEDLLQALREIVDKQPEDYGWARSTWSRELLTKTLRRVTGIRVSVRTMARMLERIGARYGMARPLPKPDWSKARKTRRVRKIMRAVEDLPTDEIAYYQDEVDIHLNPKIGRDWMLRGQQKGVVTPGQNKKRYLYGALAVDGNDFVYTTSRRKNSDGFIVFLERLRKVNPTARRIHLVLDNYIIHKSKKTKRYLAKHDDLFVLHFLPPYSPEHNRIERLWRDLHANVTRNHRCRSIDGLMGQVRAYIKRYARRGGRLASRDRAPVTAERVA